MDFLKKAVRNTISRVATWSPVGANQETRKDHDVDIFVRTEAKTTHLTRILKPPMIQYRRNSVPLQSPGSDTDYAIFLANNRFRLTEALAIFEHKASEYCDHETFIWRGVIKSMLCRRDAIVDIERGLYLSPNNSFARLAKVCHRIRFYQSHDDCMKETLKVVEKEPDNQFAAILLAILKSKQYLDYFDQISFFQDLIKKFPDNDYALAALAILFCNAKCFSQAQIYATRALKIRPGNLSAAGVLRRLNVKDRSTSIHNPWDTRKDLGHTINELLVEPLWVTSKP